MNNILNPKITMLTTDSANSIAGRVTLNGQEWDNNVKAIASYREHGICRAMTAIRSYSWLAVAAFIGDEIARLESEQ